MEQIFDKVVEYHGRFEVEQFRIGRTNSEPSYLRLKVETPDAASMEHLLAATAGAGLLARWTPAMPRCARWSATAARRRISTPPPTTTPTCATASKWIEVENQRMDAMIVVRRRPRRTAAACAICEPGDQIVVGHARHPRDARIEGARPPGVRLHVATASRPSGRWRRPCGRPRRWCGRRARAGQRVVVVAGPVVVHTGGVAGLSRLIRDGCVHARAQRQCAGRARYRSGAVRHLARRAAEPTGARKSTAIAITCAPSTPSITRGGMRGAVESGRLRSGIMYECVQADVPFVLAGSLRDDGPLPDTITDMNAAQDAYAEQLKGAGPGALPRLHAAFHRHRQHAAELGENRVRRYQSRRSPPRSAIAAPARRSAWSPTSACFWICLSKSLTAT